MLNYPTPLSNSKLMASITDRSKTYIIRKAIETYINEYSDYLVALERLNDKDDEIISGDELMGELGI
ncbi:MAG: DNA-binding protein [Halobacteriota archaeon]|nr:DNA-binding protein [Halobacteriota archaeon]